MIRRHLNSSKAHALEDSKQLLSWHVDKEKINQGRAKKVAAV
jgi:hypothetical protein